MKRIADLEEQEITLLREMLNIAVKALGAQAVVPSYSLFKKLEEAKEVLVDIDVPDNDKDCPF